MSLEIGMLHWKHCERECIHWTEDGCEYDEEALLETVKIVAGFSIECTLYEWEK